MLRYSRERILAGLMPAVVDAFGIDDDELPNSGERIDEHLKRLKLWAEIDLLDLSCRCEKTFGFKASRAEWQAFFNGGATDAAEWERVVAPKLTYDALADFIADHLPVVSFAPIEIAGRTCAAAGAFLGIRDIVARKTPRRARFAPSTTILLHLTRGQLEDLRASLSWREPIGLPALRTCWSDMIASSVFLWVLAMGGTGFACLCGGEPDLFLVFGAVALLDLVPYLILRRFENPLPQGIETFGDLARRLAEVNEAARPDKMAV